MIPFIDIVEETTLYRFMTARGLACWLSAEAEAPTLCPPGVKSRFTGKDPDAGKD